MATAALVLAILALLFNLATFVLLLILCGGRESRFAKWKDLDKLRVQVNTATRKMSILWRYLEAVDDATGGTGHQVLSRPMRGDDATPGKR